MATTSNRPKRPRLSTEERAQLQRDSLNRAVCNTSLANYAAIYAGFEAMGIPAADILPRENVFTFNAWRALGRTVRRGEHGVKVSTFIPTERKQRDPDTGAEKVVAGRYCASATVFHVSQTEPLAAKGGAA